MDKIEIDDKNLVIVCVSLLAGFSVWHIGIEAMEAVKMAITGLMGVAVGQRIK